MRAITVKFLVIFWTELQQRAVHFRDIYVSVASERFRRFLQRYSVLSTQERLRNATASGREVQLLHDTFF